MGKMMARGRLADKGYGAPHLDRLKRSGVALGEQHFVRDGHYMIRVNPNQQPKKGEGMELEFIKVEREVGKETYELVQGIVKFISAIKESAADGLDAEDFSTVISSAMTDVVPAVRGMDKLDDEALANLPATLNSIGILGSDLAEIFMKKSEAK